MNEEKRRIAAEDKLSHYLAQHKMRRTPERLAILGKVLASPRHFVVEDIFESLAADSYHVSRATVYNAINLFEACGIVRRLHLSGSADEYECVDDRSSHLHLVCTRCGKVREVKDAELSRMLALRRYPSFVMTGFDLYISGTCTRCRGGGRRKK
ncbi:MAG: transcriptional repressor [Duncaniella sp.]|nr:transcriptional repressor [Duncaniella sp.]MDE6859964.1 transcriptional repressor [Duncaniella sp.]